MTNELYQVELFEIQVVRALELQDYEFGCRDRDPEIDIPGLLSETYLRRVVMSRGRPAIRELTEWSVQTLGGKLPNETLVQLHLAYEALRRGADDNTHDALELASLSLVSDLDYQSLRLTEVAACACLSAKLTTLADHVVAGMSCDLRSRSNVIIPGDEVWGLISGDGELTDLVDILVRFFWLVGSALPEPQLVTVEQLRAQIVPRRDYGELPGFIAALWAATNGHLETLGNEIAAGLAVLTTEYELKRPMIEAQLGASLI